MAFVPYAPAMQGEADDAAGGGKPVANPFAEFLGPAARRSAAPAVRAAVPGPFAARLTAGLVALVVGVLMPYIGYLLSAVSPLETVQLRSWVTAGGLVVLVGLVLAMSGVYRLLRHLEVHLQQARRRA